MGRMARANRSRIAWFAVLVVVAAAAAIVAVRSCGTDAPTVDEAPDDPRPDAADTSRPTPPRKPPARKRAASVETTSSATGETAKPDAPETQAPVPVSKEPANNLHELRVLRADGTPAAGVEITWPQRSLWNDWPGPMMWALRKTDAEGRARVSGGAGPLYVRLGSDAGWSYKAGSVNPLPDVVLKPGVVVRGRAIDSLSCPVPSASVRAEMFPPGAGGSIVVEATSNADGEFELPPLPFDGDWWNGRQDIEVVAHAEGLVPGSASTTRTEAPKRPVVVTLYRGAALHGRLVTPDGALFPRGRVLLAGTRLAAFPEEAGRFALRLPAQGGEVIVQDSLTGTSDAEFRPARSTWFAARRLGNFRGDAGDRDLGDVVVDGGKPLRGVVVLLKSEPWWDKAYPRAVALMDGGPVAGARVTAVLAGVEILSVTTNAQGAFELPLSGDEHDLVVNERSSNRFGGIPAVEGVHGGDPEVRIVRGRLGIRVRLRDENGARLEVLGAHLNAELHAPGRTSGVSYVSSDSPLPRHEIRVQVPAVGAYDLMVSAPGLELVQVESVDVRTDRDAEIDVRMKKKP